MKYYVIPISGSGIPAAAPGQESPLRPALPPNTTYLAERVPGGAFLVALPDNYVIPLGTVAVLIAESLLDAEATARGLDPVNVRAWWAP